MAVPPIDLSVGGPMFQYRADHLAEKLRSLVPSTHKPELDAYDWAKQATWLEKFPFGHDIIHDWLRTNPAGAAELRAEWDEYRDLYARTRGGNLWQPEGRRYATRMIELTSAILRRIDLEPWSSWNWIDVFKTPLTQLQWDLVRDFRMGDLTEAYVVVEQMLAEQIKFRGVNPVFPSVIAQLARADAGDQVPLAYSADVIAYVHQKLSARMPSFADELNRANTDVGDRETEVMRFVGKGYWEEFDSEYPLQFKFSDLYVSARSRFNPRDVAKRYARAIHELHRFKARLSHAKSSPLISAYQRSTGALLMKLNAELSTLPPRVRAVQASLAFEPHDDRKWVWSGGVDTLTGTESVESWLVFLRDLGVTAESISEMIGLPPSQSGVLAARTESFCAVALGPVAVPEQILIESESREAVDR